MKLPTRFRSDLWRRMAEAQDQTVASDQVLAEAERSIARRVAAARTRGRRLRFTAGRGARVWAVALAGSLACAVGGVLLVRNFGPTASVQPGGTVPGTASLALAGGDRAADSSNRAFVADARSDLPLRFTDGSTVVFRAGSAGRMQRLSSAGAEIVLERGWLEARVVHADTTLWLVHAGPYRVRVTGTHFAMTWAGASAGAELQVDLYEGSVVIDGAVLGAGVPLRGGQRLKIASGVVLVEPLVADRASAPTAANQNGSGSGTGNGTGNGKGMTAAEPSKAAPDLSPPPTLGPSLSVQPVGASARGKRSSHDQQWLALAERGDYRGALALADGLGWGVLCRRLDARRLLTLGDVARYSGAHGRAKQAFKALVQRFPHDRLAADAVFSLGRLAFESNRPAEATRWFGRYVADWPHAPLADQAAGRVLECALQNDNRKAARGAARRYLVRAPSGPHATLAREVLDHPVDGHP